MMRGFFRKIDPEHFNSNLFEIIPGTPADIYVPNTDDKGKIITMKKAGQIREKEFRRFLKTKKKDYFINRS